MRAECNKLKQLSLVLLLALTQMACDNAVFSSQAGKEKTGGIVTPNDDGVDPNEFVFIEDSFERDDLYIDTSDVANPFVYGWRGFIRDGIQNVLGFVDPDGASIRIPPAAEFAPAGHLDRALYMYGDPDSEIEVLHIVSRSYDLSQYNTALFAFKYLTFGLNDPDDAETERLLLQVCRGNLDECGANDDFLTAQGQLSDNWVTIWDSQDNQNFNDDALNGKNHQVSDWQQALAVVDLNDPAFVGDSEIFVFRFVAVMEEGLATGQCTEKCVDECKEDDKGNRYTASTAKKDTSKCKDDHKDDKNHKHDCDKHKDCKDCKKDCKHKDCKKKDCKKDCKHKDCKKKDCKHKDCKKDCKKKCEMDCQPGDGSLRDGVAIDQLVGRATTLLIDEIF